MSTTPTETPTPGAHGDRAPVALRLPADNAYASLLRSTSAALAARLDFTLDDLEDLRMAVGEAGALVLADADAAEELVCEFHLGRHDLTVVITVGLGAGDGRDTGGPSPDRDSFGWQVLTTLADDVGVERRPGSWGLRLRMSSSLAPRA